ncbi:hypothetical protein [Frigidibacter sp. ROC022]|uniref:hypothetical protein n=1 Tax=Frigidibacter sp. ROC022 TaxID=2971796 RepID=UPI00215A1269|nr:hypothetical protein [Frigidibacter sp. ROC022]MCR8724581.1 hypothetical protein [Frigidibacter sp. ROC022]
MTSTIRRLRDILRPHVSLQSEYAIRRFAFRWLPTHGQLSAPKRIVHACAWKTASQWVRLIISDPRIYRHTGCLPFLFSQIRADDGAAAVYRKADRSVVLAAYGTAEEIDALAEHPLEPFFVVRDPRSMLVSWYHSTRFTHPASPGVCRHRAAMAGMGDAEAFLYCADAFAAEFGPILDSWARRADRVRIVRFEALTGPCGDRVWQDLFTGLGLTVPQPVLNAVLSTYALEKLVPSTARDAAGDKYASRGKRSWPDFLPGDADERLRRRLRGWARSFGYCEDAIRTTASAAGDHDRDCRGRPGIHPAARLAQGVPSAKPAGSGTRRA